MESRTESTRHNRTLFPHVFNLHIHETFLLIYILSLSHYWDRWYVLGDVILDKLEDSSQAKTESNNCEHCILLLLIKHMNRLVKKKIL